MSCSCLVMDKPKGFNFFPESVYIVNESTSIADFHSSKGTGSKYNVFVPVTFHSSKIRSTELAIHDSSLGKGYPTCRGTGSKPVHLG